MKAHSEMDKTSEDDDVREIHRLFVKCKRQRCSTDRIEIEQSIENEFMGKIKKYKMIHSGRICGMFSLSFESKKAKLDCYSFLLNHIKTSCSGIIVKDFDQKLTNRDRKSKRRMRQGVNMMTMFLNEDQQASLQRLAETDLFTKPPELDSNGLVLLRMYEQLPFTIWNIILSYLSYAELACLYFSTPQFGNIVEKYLRQKTELVFDMRLMISNLTSRNFLLKAFPFLERAPFGGSQIIAKCIKFRGCITPSARFDCNDMNLIYRVMVTLRNRIKSIVLRHTTAQQLSYLLKMVHAYIRTHQLTKLVVVDESSEIRYRPCNQNEIRRLCKACPNLEDVTIGISEFKSRNLGYLLRHCPKLKILDVAHLVGVSFSASALVYHNWIGVQLDSLKLDAMGATHDSFIFSIQVPTSCDGHQPRDHNPAGSVHGSISIERKFEMTNELLSSLRPDTSSGIDNDDVTSHDDGLQTRYRCNVKKDIWLRGIDLLAIDNTHIRTYATRDAYAGRLDEAPDDGPFGIDPACGLLQSLAHGLPELVSLRLHDCRCRIVLFDLLKHATVPSLKDLAFRDIIVLESANTSQCNVSHFSKVIECVSNLRSLISFQWSVTDMRFEDVDQLAFGSEKLRTLNLGFVRDIHQIVNMLTKFKSLETLSIERSPLIQLSLIKTIFNQENPSKEKTALLQQLKHLKSLNIILERPASFQWRTDISVEHSLMSVLEENDENDVIRTLMRCMRVSTHDWIKAVVPNTNCILRVLSWTSQCKYRIYKRFSQFPSSDKKLLTGQWFMKKPRSVGLEIDHDSIISAANQMFLDALSFSSDESNDLANV